MKKKTIWVKGKPRSFVPPANSFGNLVYTSGDGPDDLAGDIKKQTEETLRNIDVALRAGGASLRSVLKITVYLSDMKNYSMMNEVYKGFFPHDPPARTCVEVRSPMFSKGQLIEMEAVAAKSSHR
jgi:2-iminobutanoate/2-iminopropanoate deaminase